MKVESFPAKSYRSSNQSRGAPRSDAASERFRKIFRTSSIVMPSHVCDKRVSKGRAGKQSRIVHETFEVIRDCLCTDGSFHTFHDEICGFTPSHVAKHHLRREDERTRVDFVLSRVLRSGSMGGFEDRNSRIVVDVCTWGNTNAANLSSKSI